MLVKVNRSSYHAISYIMWHIFEYFLDMQIQKIMTSTFFLSVSTDYYHAIFVLGNHTAFQLCALPVLQAGSLVYIVNLTDFYAEESKKWNKYWCFISLTTHNHLL